MQAGAPAAAADRRRGADLAAVMHGVPVLFPKGLNVLVYLDINRLARSTAWAHGFMHDYALWLGLVLLAATFLAVYAVLWWRRQVRAAAGLVLGGAATVAALGLNQLVGHAARELRPYDTLHDVVVLVGRANDYAFPSDHAVVAGGLTAAVLVVLWRGRASGTTRPANDTERRLGGQAPVGALAAIAAALGLFLCFARVYVGAHYPGDVVAGLLLGAVVVGMASLLRPLAEVAAGLLLRTPLALLLRRPWSIGSAQRTQGGDGGMDESAPHRQGRHSVD
jgi:undecaprenyl-diphosphatase